MKIYVGNLPFSATEAQVRDLFAQHGAVESVALPADRETGRPRGFGFVEMPQAEAAKAIEALNGFSMGGRQLRVNEAGWRWSSGRWRWLPFGWRRWWRRRRTLVSIRSLAHVKARFGGPFFWGLTPLAPRRQT